jgi:hypothetical protein
MQRSFMATATAGLALAGAGALGAILGVGCQQHMVIEWPKEPLHVVVEMTGCPAHPTAGGGDDGGTVAQNEPVGPAMGKPNREKMGSTPLVLAVRGTLVYVEYANGGSADSVKIYDVDGKTADDCSAGRNRKDLWTLTNGRRWDAQVQVASGRVVCIESGGYAEGDAEWMVRP